MVSQTRSAYLVLMAHAAAGQPRKREKTGKQGGLLVNAKNASHAITRMEDAGFPSAWPALAPRSDRLLAALVFGVCGWSLIEAPLEIGVVTWDERLIALVLSKLLVIGAAVAAALNLRFARGFFSFLCGASVLAIAPGLPLEYSRSVAIALFSTVECLTKAAWLIAVGLASLDKARSQSDASGG
jgi:hypothetical protein